MGCGLADVAHVEVFWNGAGHREPGCDVSKRRVPLTSGMAGDWSLVMTWMLPPPLVSVLSARLGDTKLSMVLSAFAKVSNALGISLADWFSHGTSKASPSLRDSFRSAREATTFASKPPGLSQV